MGAFDPWWHFSLFFVCLSTLSPASLSQPSCLVHNSTQHSDSQPKPGWTPKQSSRNIFHRLRPWNWHRALCAHAYAHSMIQSTSWLLMPSLFIRRMFFSRWLVPLYKDIDRQTGCAMTIWRIWWVWIRKSFISFVGDWGKTVSSQCKILPLCSYSRFWK